MEQPREAAKAEFLQQTPTHVSKEMLDSTPIYQLITEKGEKVWVPWNWEGVYHQLLIEFDWLPDTPQSHRVLPSQINPRKLDNVNKELDRLEHYHIRPSTSGWSSPIVAADKKTPPYVRICGDYTYVNKFIINPSRPIPNIPHELAKIQGHKYFADIDWANAFHQFRLGPKTSKMLALQTHRGLYEPVFMPDGVPLASGILQQAANTIFGGQDWTFVAFDNIVMAKTLEELYRRVEWVVDRAIEYNVVLKFSKSYIGFTEVEFFGYICRENYHELSASRIETIRSMPFPDTLKKMQQFLGVAIFCARFIRGFSTTPLSYIR